MRKHKVAEGTRPDSGPLHFLSTVSSAAGVAVLQGDKRQGNDNDAERM